MTAGRSPRRKGPAHEYRQAMILAAGSCPIEMGLVGNLADNECAHGRLPGDLSNRCGCWAEEGAVLRVVTGAQQQLFDIPDTEAKIA